MNILDVFFMNEYFKKGVILDFRKLIDYSQGGIASKQILKSEGGNITLFSFDQGQSLSEHRSPFDAMIQLIEGEAVVVLDGDSYSIKCGESFLLPSNVPHAVKAYERFKMLLTMIK